MQILEPKVAVPKFVEELRGTRSLYEGQTARFRCQVEYVPGVNLRVAFYHNDKALESSHRHHFCFVFGYICLDIENCVPEDTGVYGVEVVNTEGQVTSTASVIVIAKPQTISQLESPEMFKLSVPVTTAVQRPMFTQPLQKICYIQEGQVARFECSLLPVGDPTLKVEWFRIEKPMDDSFRITKKHDLLHTGYVSMTIEKVCYLDEGVYMCRASNLFGECVTKGALKIRSDNGQQRTIIFKPQYPTGLKQIRQTEMHRLLAKVEIVVPKVSLPKFAKRFKGTKHVYVGQTAHFQCQVEYLRDPNFYIKFYHNGEALQHCLRKSVTFQFGCVSLDIYRCVPEDAGQYSIELINAVGSTLSSTKFMKVLPKRDIISESQRPQGVNKIHELSAEPFEEPEIPRERPTFTQQLQDIHDIEVGQTAHFKCRLFPTRDPALKVVWFRNKTLIENSWRIKKTDDLLHTGCVSIVIANVRVEDEGVYTCRASNLFGESVTRSVMTIKTTQLIETQFPLSSETGDGTLVDLNKIHQPQQKRQRRHTRWDRPPADLCLVCGDKTSNKNYEVPSCNDCREFFDESLRLNLGYVCNGSGTCVVDVKDRNKCQACRFSKCLRVKMNKDDGYFFLLD